MRHIPHELSANSGLLSKKRMIIDETLLCEFYDLRVLIHHVCRKADFAINNLFQLIELFFCNFLQSLKMFNVSFFRCDRFLALSALSSFFFYLHSVSQLSELFQINSLIIWLLFVASLQKLVALFS